MGPVVTVLGIAVSVDSPTVVVTADACCPGMVAVVLPSLAVATSSIAVVEELLNVLGAFVTGTYLTFDVTSMEPTAIFLPASFSLATKVSLKTVWKFD